MKCRHCKRELHHLFLDLGTAPPSNALLTPEALDRPEPSYPLRLFVCEHCWLVQTEDFTASNELFGSDYAYFSSVSHSWLAHAARYAEEAILRLGLDHGSYVIEVAANDGYLLKNFVAAGIPCLGIEPTDSTADVAEQAGVPIMREFFGERLGAQLAGNGDQADLIIGNNVYAHVPDINDFTAGLKHALKPGGTINLEFPHLMQLLDKCQFDTVYHEHFSYLSLYTVIRVFHAAGLRVFDVEELPTHGGSLRIHACHADDERSTTLAVDHLLAAESKAGMRGLEIYQGFQHKADHVKNDLLRFLHAQKAAGKSVAGYGAAAKGSTLLNYAGVNSELLPYICDAAPFKQGKFLPGARIPILHPDELENRKPDLVLILPWNLQAEITRQLDYIDQWGGKFAVAIPNMRVF